ncbi:transmembrane protein, putative (macronuclear) [Tetrahymena thermophila SB210]|uniref:Transmembrane protein, putative n=1 Tax=Tetrahymena thermophila (strain SB210) TaxID=312017 RepID=W7X631_TETTS|nr:transmembrane protein, putative [Tetrahymena thermophila SB210]EWS72852.1 transmembrane protein, putative [Tetrahymena thermophila SB210]|eukprot:XP_012654606.1 transmembrane protein, putative [Tetrahymena thermophila SB210]
MSCCLYNACLILLYAIACMLFYNPIFRYRLCRYIYLFCMRFLLLLFNILVTKLLSINLSFLIDQQYHFLLKTYLPFFFLFIYAYFFLIIFNANSSYKQNSQQKMFVLDSFFNSKYI